MAEQVSLYTSHQMNDPSPQVFQYYIDWTGNDVAQAAANYLGLQYDPTYGLLLVSPYGSQWIDLSSTLRAQNVTNGYQIVYISLQYAQQGFNQSTYPQQQSNTNGNNENSSIQQIQQIQIEDVDIAEIPTIEVGNSTLNESDSDDVDDIIIDQSITDFSTNAFGGVRASDLSLLTGESDSVSSKSVKIFTAYEFSEENPVEVSYKLSYKFDDLLSTAFHHLSHNREGRYCLLLQYSKEDCRWLKEGEYLEDFNPFDGMTMYVFKRDRPIKVNIEHHPSKTLLLDIQKPVKELVEDVAKKNGLETFLGFTLWSWDSKHKSFPMLPNLSIPQQTRSIKSVVFKRKYFIFSREDLSTLETTISAFQDAVVEFHQSKHAYINDDTALNFLALCFLAESDKPEISNISEHLLGYLPPTFTHGKQILPKLKPFIQKFEKVDRFNACRKVLRFLRRTPGFATTVYDNVKIEVKTNKKKTVVDMSIHISPLTIRIINPKSNVLEDRISISKIISLNLLGDNLEIQFSIVSADGRTGKYNFRCPQVEEMKSLIETYSQISKMIIYFRAQANASIAGFDLSAIDDKNRITLFTTTDLTDAKPRKYAYDSKFTGAALIKCAEQNLEIPADKNHVALVKLMKNSYRWIEPETILSFANVQDGMTVYILNNNRPIKIKHTDGHTKTLLLDITQTIESLTPLIFQKEALPNIVGYTFYTLEDPNNPRPLDTRYSIPEQTWKFDELLFKRRFYVLSGEVLQTPQAAFATVADCNTLLLDPTSPLKVSEDEIIQLGIMFLYSRASSPEEIKVNKKINYEELIPSYIKTDKKFDAKFQKALASFPPQDKLQAAKNYLGFIRQLRGFGEEKFTVIYTDMSFGSHCKPIINTSLSIGPLKIIITPPNAKQQLHSIPYRFIISFQSMAHRLSMKFVDNGKIMTAEFKIREIDTALMLINYNIKIIRDLMLAKQRKKQKDEEDTAKRLNGGYIDENGVLRTRMLDFLISAKLDRRENLPKMWIEVNKTGKEVADLIVPILRLNNKIEYAILLWMLRKYYKWVGNEETLASKNPYRRTIMFILEAYPKVKVIFTMGATKTIIIHIIKTIAEIVPVIAQKLGLKHAIGFTLYLPIEGKESKPLNLTLSLPEQTNYYDVLEFRRRFYVISKYDMDDPQSLYMTFCDVRALILSGKVDMVLEKAIELMYYALHVDAPTKITKDTLPISDKEIPPYIPQGMKPSSSKSKKILLDMLSKIKIDSRDFAMIKYIQIARALPTFGTEAFLVVLVEEKKGHQVRTNVHLYVGPYRVFIKDENKKRELVEVPYKRFISLETVENELSMKYCGDDFKARYVDIESEAAEEIASLILSHLNIHKQILMKRVEDNDQSGVDRLELLTIFCSDIEHAKRCVYDMKDKGRQIIDKAIKYLNLNPRGQYSCLLRRCDDEFTWVHDDEVIGIYNPFDGLTVHIYMTYMPVELSTNTFKRTMLLNIERPIHQLIDEIAFKMYVDFPLGYTLYRYEGNEKIALDLYETIPEQVIEFSKLFFQRRFLLTTHEDVLSPWISPLIYPDVVRNILSGIPVVEDKDFKIAKELVIYQIIASSASGEEAVRTFGSKNVMEYLPKDMKVPKNFRESILSNLRNNMTLKKQLAISKLIITARALNHFGCMIFPSQLDDKSKPSNKKEPQRKNCMISIGPFGVHLYAQGNNNLIIDFAKIDYSNVVSFTIIKDRIILRVSEDGGIPHIITVISKYSVQIHKLLRQYKNILIPMMDERKEIQGLAHSVEIKSLLEKSKVKSIQVYPERQLDHPNPHIFQFGKNMKSDELAALGLYYIVYPNKSSHTILATNRRKPDEKDVSYTWLKPNEDLFTANPVDNSYMFIIESTPLAQIITPDNFVYEKRYLIEEIIISICKSFTIDFKLGTHLGYTLYEMMNGKQRPLDFLFPVPLVSPNYVELLLKRRFYLFSLEILNDPLSLESGYEDVKAMVLSGTLIMSVETSLDLTMYSLYAESNTQQEVLVKANEINEEDLKYIIPRNISVSPAILRKFKAVATSTVPVDNKQAKIRYIILANSINGYGAENYPCLFTDRVDVTKKARRPANIILTPYRITVEDERTRKFFTVISWHTINVYDRINNTVELTYNNEDGVFCHIELESVPYSREIFSFINDMLELLRRPEFAEFPDFMGGSKNKLGANDFSGYGYNDNDNHSSMYDDISNIDARGLDLVFGDGDTDKDGYDFDDGTNDRFKYADGNDYCWRASDDGLLMNRAGNLLDNMFDDLNLIRNNLGEMDPNDLYRQLNFMNDELRRFANELEGEDRDRFLSLSSGLDGLRETAQQIARSDMEISSFIPQLQSMIDKYMCALSPAQQFFTQKLKALQLKSGDDPDLGTPRTLRLPHDDGNLAMMLLNLSDIQEQIASCLHKNYGNITPIIDPASLIRQLQGASTTLTTFAANLVNQNGDPEMIRRHLIPQLNDVGKIREIISALVDKGRKMNIKLPGLDDLCSQLGTSLQGILSSSSLTRVNPGQRKYFSMYPGQIKPLENVLPEFKSLLKSVDTLMAHPSIKANPPLQHSIFAKCKHISQDIESLLAAIKVLKINANDDLARSEALAALLDAKASFEFLSAALQPLGNVPQIASFLKKLTDGYPKVISALNQLSPVNITPVNCQFVLDDVNMLLNRYASLSPEVVERLTDQERNSTAKTISFLKDFVQQFDRIVPALDKSPTSGEVVFLAQKSLLRLYDMLPDIQGFATALHRITIDQTYPVLYERLITNVRSTLNEPDSTEDISKLPHLINFQQLQVDTGNVMNLIRQICIHPRILTDPDLKERIETLFKQLKDNYLQQVLTRVQIRERPFSDDSIVLAHDIVARLRMLIDKMQPTARKVSDITSNLQLEQLLNALMLQSDKTLELLKKAKMEPFHLPPKVQDVQKLAEATYKMNQVIVALSKLNSVTKDGAVLEAFTNAYESLNSSYENLKALEKNPTNDFYRIAGKLQKSLIKLTPFISPIPEFNKNAQHRKVMSDLYDAITNALKSTPPTLEIVKSTVKGLQPCLLDFTNLLNAFLKAQNVKSNKEATNLFNGWLVDINEANTIISECINSKDFDISMANAIKVALLNLMKKLSSMPLNVRDVLTKEQKIELATKLGNLAKLAILTVNCIRQLPGNKRIYSNPHHFKKIEADDEFIESIQAIGNQCGSLQEFFKDLIEAKTLGDRPYAFALIQELQNQLSWVSLNDFKPNIPESKQLTIMQQLKERIPFVVTSTELIAPIIGDPNIVKNIKLFGDNLTIMTRLLSSPHLTAETAEKFKALVTPQMNKLLLEIDPVIKKDSVKSIRLLLD
ncbi:hypothetical protein TRFO_20137 [Tritrichomonas foetus]|uniref:FERM domain-containing protein n=1 Tax=Tritrichomonas foetus TaxID=1144522 RepID=A0A1J4KGQ0_9EUKA|nr:hypothetical protein TRFO_20137 [Tritrichomonas foetus]|eukprot:OHT10545.1 hypothetical protein TRFO_20137 [Tritrichomonas foetus]